MRTLAASGRRRLPVSRDQALEAMPLAFDNNEVGQGPDRSDVGAKVSEVDLAPDAAGQARDTVEVEVKEASVE
jgi:hypothetical protein